MICLELFISPALKLGRLALGPQFHQLFSAGCGSKSETGLVTHIKQSNISTDRQDLQSDLIFPIRENPLSQQAVDSTLNFIAGT